MTVPAEVVPDDALVLGVDIGGTSTKAEISDHAGTIVAAAAAPTPHGPQALEAAAALGENVLSQLPGPDRGAVARAAVVMPGIVDTERGVAVFSGNIGWHEVQARSGWAERWQLPVLIDHDATAAGWAEWQVGAGRGMSDVCVVIAGTGIGGVLTVAGRLVEGARGQPGEYGHIPVRPDGLPCPCGNVGCVETVASSPAIARAYTRRSGRPAAGAADVFAVLGTDPIARAVWTDAVDALADGMVGIMYATCPERLVLGGGLAAAGRAMTEPFQRALDKRLVLVRSPDVVAGMFGVRAGLVGAALLARRGARVPA